eukprot:6078166-Alexandrium_andersonii.AAC.1
MLASAIDPEAFVNRNVGADLWGVTTGAISLTSGETVLTDGPPGDNGCALNPEATEARERPNREAQHE